MKKIYRVWIEVSEVTNPMTEEEDETPCTEVPFANSYETGDRAQAVKFAEALHTYANELMQIGGFG